MTSPSNNSAQVEAKYNIVFEFPQKEAKKSNQNRESSDLWFFIPKLT